MNFKKKINLYFQQFLIYTKRPLTLFDNWAAKGRLNWMPDKWFLTFMFRSKMGYWMNWKNPKTFNEKLQWLKIHDRNPLYTKLVDKYEVRQYIAQKIGPEYLIPLLGVWDRFEDIDFDKLPNQFVIKCTHDSGSIIICKNKASFDYRDAERKIKNALKIKYYTLSREWPYKNVRPRIIVEEYLKADDLKDYKFQVYNGIVQNCFVCSRRFTEDGLHVTFFDKQWNLLNFTKLYPKEKISLEKPFYFSRMVEISEILASNIRFLRVDFFEYNNKVYLGELTFYPGAGFEKFTPFEWDKKFGDFIDLFDYKKGKI